MAVKVELPKPIVKRALEQSISSIARQIKAATNPVIQDALEKELTALRAAENTLTEIK